MTPVVPAAEIITRECSVVLQGCMLPLLSRCKVNRTVADPAGHVLQESATLAVLKWYNTIANTALHRAYRQASNAAALEKEHQGMLMAHHHGIAITFCLTKSIHSITSLTLGSYKTLLLSSRQARSKT
jgi:hypothetical protein